MSVTFNQFQKELNKRISDPQVAYMLTLMYEQVYDMGQQVDMCATVITQVVGALENTVHLSDTALKAVGDIRNKDKRDGISVETMAVDPSDS